MVKEAKEAEMVKATEASEHDLEPRKLEYSPSRKSRLAPDPALLIHDSAIDGTRVESMALMAFCFVGLQASYLTWGYLQEKVMTTEYTTGRFPSAAFCVFSNRVFAIVVAAI